MIQDTQALAKEILGFQIEKHIRILFKNQLEMLDFLAAEQCDDGRPLMGEQTKQRYRKLFLSTGNDTIRVLQKELEKYEVNFNNKKES